MIRIHNPRKNSLSREMKCIINTKQVLYVCAICHTIFPDALSQCVI